VIRNCDPLDGGVAKDRPVVVVISPIEESGKPLIVVACSTQGSPSEHDKVELPNTETEPQTKSGLHQRCWAIPRWHFPVERNRLEKRIGYLTGRKLQAILAAYYQRVLGSQK